MAVIAKCCRKTVAVKSRHRLARSTMMTSSPAPTSAVISVAKTPVRPGALSSDTALEVNMRVSDSCSYAYRSREEIQGYRLALCPEVHV
eukprot:21059-Heterococcus_DN1.PRE.2